MDNSLSMRRFFVLSSGVGVVLLVSLFFIVARATSCTLEYGPDTPVPKGYGAAYDVFSAGKELILALDCRSSQTTFVAGSGNSNQVVYEKAWKYVSGGDDPGWKEISFSSGERFAAGSPWFKGTASTIIPQSLIESGKNHIVAYTCTYIESAWRCGCSDTTCSTHKWQLQSFEVSTAPPPPPPPGSTPDLAIYTLSRTPGDAIVPAGTLMSFSTLVVNAGNADAPISQTRLFIDDTVISPDQETGILSKNGGSEAETWVHVWSATLGTHTYKVCADSTNSVSEGAKETNNCTTSSFTVSGTSTLLSCSPSTQTKQTGETVSVSALGGTESYTWSAPGGTTVSGTGTNFSTAYASTGVKTITVTNGSQYAQCIATITEQPTPSGFWDEGFKQGVVRSDLGDIKDITVGSCLYNDASRCAVNACAVCQRNGAKNYSRSNFYSSVSPAPSDSFWVLDHNDDSGGLGGAFSNSCHTGPPNQSFQVGTIGSANVFGFALEDTSTGKRARLALKNKYNACGSNAIPYLGIGAQKDRGNKGKNVGSFVKDKTGLRVNFTASLDKCDTRADRVGSPCLIYLDVITRWNGKPRQFFVYLAHQNHTGSPGKGAHVHWNWPNTNSYFYPGSDLAYRNCEDVGVPCLRRGETKDFSVDIDKLLISASKRGLFDDKIPEGIEIPIEGIHWSIETAGPSAGMEATVSNMTTQVLTY